MHFWQPLMPANDGARRRCGEEEMQLAAFGMLHGDARDQRRIGLLEMLEVVVPLNRRTPGSGSTNPRSGAASSCHVSSG